MTVYASKKQHEWIVQGSHAEAELFEARMKLDLRGAKKIDPRAAPTFSAFCVETYRPWAETHLGADTWRKVRIYQVATLEEHLGPLKLSEISEADIQRYKSTRLASRVAKAPGINNELRVLRSMLNHARSWKLPVADVSITLLPTRGSRRVFCWSPADVAKLYAAAADVAPEIVPMLVFLLNTGCRKGEALRAQWSWIDWRRGMVSIPVTDEWQPKGRRAREVPMSDALRATLRGKRAHRVWLFPNSLGERYRSFPKEAFWRARDAAKLRGGPHTTRHTFASIFLQAEPDLFLLAQVLGHSHARTTELYAHLLPGHLARAKNAVNLSPQSGRSLAKRRAS